MSARAREPDRERAIAVEREKERGRQSVRVKDVDEIQEVLNHETW